ncbi:MAG: BON domain-containing protein [Xanthomonadales bacterium]|nr:BON domain-containing protein [Xanthomonadales bacterium]
MYKQTRKLVLASAITLALASVSGAAAAAATEQDVIEARQESQIETTYSLSRYLRANDIQVSVDDGTATLSGTVEEDVNKDLAKQIALGVTGIKTVDNQIMVAADYTPPARSSEDRSFGEVVDDATITASIKSKLLWSKSTEGLDMDVDSRMGMVTLNGTADTGASKELAGRMAKNTHGVIAVDNKLLVENASVAADPKNAASENETTQALSDGWITTKVKSTYMYSSNVDSDEISVSTDAGIVTLTGKVASGAERALATELAQNVRGVKSVNATALTF